MVLMRPPYDSDTPDLTHPLERELVRIPSLGMELTLLSLHAPDTELANDEIATATKCPCCLFVSQMRVFFTELNDIESIL